MLKKLDHRALPRVYRVFDDDSHRRTYMLMDYIEGPNLETLRRQRAGKCFTPLQVLTVLAPIVDAVRYLHSQQPPVLHRDIYALGATMYTLLTGKLPEDALDRMTKTSSNEPDPLVPVRTLVPNIPLAVAKSS